MGPNRRPLKPLLRAFPFVPLALGVSFLSSLRAESFKILGARPLGMGGAFVAVAEDSLAQYWNPAGIAGQKMFDLETPVNLRAELTGGILQDINTVGDLADSFSKVKDAQTNGTGLDVEEMSSLFTTVKTLDRLDDPGKGILLEAQGGLGLRIMRLALSVNNFTSAGGVPFVDTANIGLGQASGASGVSFSGADTADPADAALLAARNDAQAAIDTVGYGNLQDLVGAAGLAAGGITNSQELANALVNAGQSQGLSAAQIAQAAADMKDSAASAKPIIESAASGNPYTQNASNVTLRGISMTEVAVGYGHRFFFDGLTWGANVKALVGVVGFFREEFLKDSLSGSKTLDHFNNNTKQSIQPGLDLGLMYDKREQWRTKFGVTAKNVNNPRFSQPAAAGTEPKYRVQPQVRAGLAFYPFKRKFWVIATDLDLTNNITPIPGFSSRMLGLGTEVNVVNSNLFNLAVRAGAMRNLAEKDSKLTYTGGVELKLLHFFVSAAGALSSQREEIKGLSSSDAQKIPQNVQAGVSLGLNW